MIALLLVLLFVVTLYDLIHRLENIAGSLTLIVDYLKKMKGDRLV